MATAPAPLGPPLTDTVRYRTVVLRKVDDEVERLIVDRVETSSVTPTLTVPARINEWTRE